MERAGGSKELGSTRSDSTMRDQVLWRKKGRIVALLTDRLGIDIERALDILCNSHTYTLLINPDSGLQLQSDEYILTDLLRELETWEGNSANRDI